MTKSDNMKDFPSEVFDEKGRVYHLDEKIGEGGQGAVFLAKEKGIVIKLIRFSAGDKFEFKDKEKIKEAQASFRKIKNISLEDMKIKLPLAILDAPYVGYVMEILDDMIPLKDFMFKDADVLIPKDEETFNDYVKSGSLKRRLKVLMKIADTMSQLHSKGLVFADPSPDNFFISKNIEEDEISLIDADNLEYQSKLNKRIIYTPPYGAPELVKGISGVNTLTDAHAFAVIAFWMLTGVHPRYGNLVTDGEPEMEDKAQKGEIPWIDDTNDDSNYTDNGMPRDMVLTPKLKELFAQTFGKGVEDYLERPCLVAWENALTEALNSLVPCQCGFYYYATHYACPVCQESKPPLLLVSIKSWLPLDDEIKKIKEIESLSTTEIASLILSDNEPLYLNGTHIQGKQISSLSEDCLSLEYDSKKNEISIFNLDRGRYFLASNQMTEKKQIKRKEIISIPGNEKEQMLHFDDESKYHRVATFIKI